MTEKKKLVLVGDSAYAEIAHEYFTYDSPYEVVGFAVEAAHRNQETLRGLPVVSFEEMEQVFDPATHSVHVAIVYTEVNRLRARLLAAAKAKGYAPASYVSSRAFVWRNVQMGEHCFIFENNVVQPFVTLGSNIILWSGNHIGHHSTIGDNCFVSSHVVIAGFVKVEANCFLGINSSISNGLVVGADCWLGPGVNLTRNAPAGSLYKPEKVAPAPIGTLAYFKVTQ